MFVYTLCICISLGMSHVSSLDLIGTDWYHWVLLGSHGSLWLGLRSSLTLDDNVWKNMDKTCSSILMSQLWAFIRPKLTYFANIMCEVKINMWDFSHFFNFYRRDIMFFIAQDFYQGLKPAFQLNFVKHFNLYNTFFMLVK